MVVIPKEFPYDIIGEFICTKFSLAMRQDLTKTLEKISFVSGLKRYFHLEMRLYQCRMCVFLWFLESFSLLLLVVVPGTFKCIKSSECKKKYENCLTS